MTRILIVVLALAATIILGACAEELTPESFAEIEQGMTMSQVETILGGSGEDQTAGGVGIGATGLEGQQATENVYVWTDGDAQIIVTFRDGKVHQKRQVNLE